MILTAEDFHPRNFFPDLYAQRYQGRDALEELENPTRLEAIPDDMAGVLFTFDTFTISMTADQALYLSKVLRQAALKSKKLDCG
jgi:hypothetical protein